MERKEKVTEMKKETRQCRFFHSWGEWEPLKNPEPYITSAMYRCGVKPTMIRTCKDCGEEEIKLEKWD
jgi:hypothetical protein